MFNVEVVKCKAGNVIINVDDKEFMNVLPPKKEYIQYLENEDEFNTNVFIELNIKNFDEEEDIGIIDVMYYPNELIRRLMHDSDFDVFVKKCEDTFFTEDDNYSIPVYEIYIRNFSDPEVPIVAHIATLSFIDINDEKTPRQFDCLFKDEYMGGFYSVSSRTKNNVLVDGADDLLEEYNLNIKFES